MKISARVSCAVRVATAQQVRMLILCNNVNLNLMNSQIDDYVQESAHSAVNGKVDALTAAVFGILELCKNMPELSTAIKDHLATQYADRLVDSQDLKYIKAFDDTRAQLLKIIR